MSEKLLEKIHQLETLLAEKQEIINKQQHTITQLRKSETALETAMRERKKISHAIDHLPVMLVATDYNDQIVVWNKECEINTGYTLSEISKQLFLKIVLGKNKAFPETNAIFVENLVQIQTKNHKPKTIRWKYISQESPVPGWKKWAIGWDVSKQQQLHNKLTLQKQKLLQQNIEIQSRNEELNSQNEEIHAILDELERNQNSLLEMNSQLELSRYRYEYFVDNINIGVWFGKLKNKHNLNKLSVQQQTKIILNQYVRENANKALLEMYGYTNLNEYLNDEKKNEKIIQYPEIEHVGNKNYILKKLITEESDKFGQTKYFAINILSIHQLQYPNQIWGTQRDITEQFEFQRKIQESEKKFASVFELSPDGIMLVDYSTAKILNVNAAFLKYSGYSIDQVIHKTSKELNLWTSNDDRDVLMDLLSAEGQFFNIEKVLFNRRREKYTFLISSVVFNIEEKKYILSIFKDVSDRKILEQKYLQSVIRTEEKERKRFAEDLHDDLGPLLSTVKLYVSSLKSQKFSDQQKNTIIENVNEVIEEAITTTKNISNNLMPNVLLDFGIQSAIKSFLEMVSKPNSIHINFEYNINGYQMEKHKEVAIFKITKELVNNTIKHAHAKQIHIKMSDQQHQIIYTYTDNGKGFDLNQILASEKSGMGLRNIYSRTKSIDGEVFVETDIGKGVRVTIITEK